MRHADNSVISPQPELEIHLPNSPSNLVLWVLQILRRAVQVLNCSLSHEVLMAFSCHLTELYTRKLRHFTELWIGHPVATLQGDESEPRISVRRQNLYVSQS